MAQQTGSGGYRWANPQEWLSTAVEEWQPLWLRWAVRQMAQKMEADDLQDIFEAEMDADGYFDTA